uniref:Transposase (Putative), gypsy type n=1 Tax=Tanacetum cinerariifolium TaxID=118510 RepID=A0A699HBD1_TANCI|nr:hypothetical protein [Tanacetum cinerariifolium]
MPTLISRDHDDTIYLHSKVLRGNLHIYVTCNRYQRRRRPLRNVEQKVQLWRMDEDKTWTEVTWRSKPKITYALLVRAELIFVEGNTLRLLFHRIDTSTDIQPVVVTTDTIVENVAPLQPKRQRKRKTVVDDAGGPSHPPKKFVISSDSSHHSGANIAEAEVDSIVRSSAPSIATVTTMTTTIDADATAARAPIVPSLFGVGSSSTVYVPRWRATNGFGLDDSGICLEMLDEFAPQKFFASVRGVDHDQLFTEFNVGAARQISLNAEAELLKVKDGEIESLKAQLLLKEAKAVEAIHLRAEVFKFEAAEQSLRGEVRVLRDHDVALEREKNELSVKVTDLSASVKVREQKVADLDAQVSAVKLQNDNLVGQVHELEISSDGLHEKVDAYEDFVGQLEKFYDEKLEEVNEKFDKLCADFVDMALHLKEKFYPHLLTTISGRRWLLTHGMELAVVKCLNSTEYLSALGAAISKAVEKGMQEGLSAGITYGAEGRKLADVAAYNPSAKADYLSALQHLQNVNFSLIAKLKSNKDASVDTIMNLLRLDDVHAKRLGLTEFQPHVNQLMVPIHHYPDQGVVALCGVFVPLSEPFSAMALEGMKGGAGVDDETATVDNMNPFSDVSNAELNIPE